MGTIIDLDNKSSQLSMWITEVLKEGKWKGEKAKVNKQ